MPFSVGEWMIDLSTPLWIPAFFAHASQSVMYSSISLSLSHLKERRRECATSVSQQSSSDTSSTTFEASARHASSSSTAKAASCRVTAGSSKQSSDGSRLSASSSEPSYDDSSRSMSDMSAAELSPTPRLCRAARDPPPTLPVGKASKLIPFFCGANSKNVGGGFGYSTVFRATRQQLTAPLCLYHPVLRTWPETRLCTCTVYKIHLSETDPFN